MYCCDLLGDAVEQGAMYYGPKNRINDGRIVNDLDTEYFLRSASSRGYDYHGINYCPFCGARPLTRALDGREEKIASGAEADFLQAAQGN